MSNGPQQKIGFIGVGMMGHGICLNLIKAGFPLTVIAHRNRARIDDLLGRGAAEAKSLRELAADADVVMICVNSADSVAELVREMLPAMSAGKMIIDVTTSKPETSEMLAAEAKAKGVTFIDAPVVGGPPQAAEGKLG
ncbi:MAG TPA: NAD(P)-binding domain-containing protein, partial [Hyphomicrobiaceae bacterium]